MLMPLLGQTMEEGTIIKWMKNEGDNITEGEPLLEVMTDKVNMEVEAPESGVLLKILAQADEIVAVQNPIAIIGAAGESIDDLLADEPAAKAAETAPDVSAPAQSAPAPIAEAAQPIPAPPAVAGKIISSPSARREARQRGIDIDLLAGKGTGPNGRIIERDVIEFAASMRATPLAGKVAADMGVDLGGLTGTGIGGRITRSDVERTQASVPAGIGSTIPFTGMRKIVAQNVSASAHSAVHVTLVTEVDMAACVALREQLLSEVEKQYGVRISYTDIIVKAAAKAVFDVPIVNATLSEDKIVIADTINIGIATAIEGGLLVPVIKNVQSKSVIDISREIKTLAQRARAGKSTADDLAGGTFTITNLGVYGVDTFTPVITPGQSAILAICRIVDKPVVVKGEVVIRPMMNLCLSFDHRIMDGAPAAEYLARLRDILQAPGLILL
jgi:pyruvate dehydrogenase E2 component (dihydrolipoamide acetyltransferase)